MMSSGSRRRVDLHKINGSVQGQAWRRDGESVKLDCGSDKTNYNCLWVVSTRYPDKQLTNLLLEAKSLLKG